jgi:hypothetical protein
MGGKRPRRRKQIHLCLALLMLIGLSACTFSQTTSSRIIKTTEGNTKTTEGDIKTAEGDAKYYLASSKMFLARGDYASALKENERALSLAGKDTPADESLFMIGLIYAHPANPARDYGKSLGAFRRLTRDYPGSVWVEQAKTIAGLLQENDRLGRTVEKLNLVIDELKKVDIDVDRKKRERER